MKKKISSIIFMVVCLLLLMSGKAFATQKGSATITVERFVLGGDYIVEPTIVEFTEGQNCEDLFKKVADSKNLKYTISKSAWGGVNYLEGIEGVDCGNNAPQEVKDVVTKTGLTIEENKNNGLYGGSYTTWAGWMFSVNNEFGNESIDQRKVKDGDVIRFVFSLTGGSDINGLTYDGQQLYKTDPGNKTELIKMLGKANQATVKSYYKNDKNFNFAYEDANEVMADVVASQYDINDVTSALEVYVTNSKKLEKPSISKVTPVSYKQLKLTWKKVKDATGYEVVRSTSAKSGFKKVKATTATTYTNNVTTGKTYYYKVRAYKTINGQKYYSDYSSLKSGKTKFATPKLTAKAGKKKATLTWKKVSGATGYTLYRSTNKTSKFKKVTTTKKTTYQNKSLSKKTYYYKLRAYKTVSGKKVYSAYSSVVKVKVK